MSILELKERIENMPSDYKEIFNRFFVVSESTGPLKIPESFYEKVQKWFGKQGESLESLIDRVEHQKIVRVFNKINYEEALFNELRSRRPTAASGINVDKYIIDKKQGCDFCDLLNFTATDLGFSNANNKGRVQGKYWISGSNIAKCESAHSNIIALEHDPLHFSKEEIIELFSLANKWFEGMQENRNELVYGFLGWNILEKAGASQVHRHVQVGLSDAPHHFGKVEKFLAEEMQYEYRYHSNYLDDLWKVHENLGLEITEEEGRGIFSLTPLKEKEALIKSATLEDAAPLVYRILRCYIDKMGVNSLNVGAYLPKFRTTPKDSSVILRIVDRGDVNKKPVDIASWELYGASVISSDPFYIAEEVKKSFS